MNINDISYLVFFTLVGLALIYFGIKHNKEKQERMKDNGAGGHGGLGLALVLVFLPHWVYQTILIGFGGFLIFEIWHLLVF